MLSGDDFAITHVPAGEIFGLKMAGLLTSSTRSRLPGLAASDIVRGDLPGLSSSEAKPWRGNYSSGYCRRITLRSLLLLPDGNDSSFPGATIPETKVGIISVMTKPKAHHSVAA